MARAAQLGFDTLGLTDRDWLYVAIRFAKACLAACIAPVIGVDLAVPADVVPDPRRGRSPVRGGQLRDPRHPRVVVTARSKAGWAALCRLVSGVHLTGERGAALAALDQIARAAAGGDLVVQLGADSTLGLAASWCSARRRELRTGTS